MNSEDEYDSQWDDEVDDPAGDDDDDTLPCPACGAAVYDDTDRCPHCGQWIMPLNASSRPNRVVLIVAVLMIVLMLLWAIF